MNTNRLLRNFLAKICEKDYSQAESLLHSVLIEKMKDRVKSEHKKMKENKKKTLQDDKK